MPPDDLASVEALSGSESILVETDQLLDICADHAGIRDWYLQYLANVRSSTGEADILFSWFKVIVPKE